MRGDFEVTVDWIMSLVPCWEWPREWVEGVFEGRAAMKALAPAISEKVSEKMLVMKCWPGMQERKLIEAPLEEKAE